MTMPPNQAMQPRKHSGLSLRSRKCIDNDSAC
jgi:hypothetical protein